MLGEVGREKDVEKKNEKMFGVICRERKKKSRMECGEKKIEKKNRE